MHTKYFFLKTKFNLKEKCYHFDKMSSEKNILEITKNELNNSL